MDTLRITLYVILVPIITALALSLMTTFSYGIGYSAFKLLKFFHKDLSIPTFKTLFLWGVLICVVIILLAASLLT